MLGINFNGEATPPGSDVVWVGDALPAGATQNSYRNYGSYVNEAWSSVGTGDSPAPYAGTWAHQSNPPPSPIMVHQHYFTGGAPLSVNVGDTLFTYVYLEPTNPPTEIMLQWYGPKGWLHRAYWGANSIPAGTDGTNERRYMGALPGYRTMGALERARQLRRLSRCERKRHGLHSLWRRGDLGSFGEDNALIIRP